MGRRSSNLISYIPYDDRGLLRTTGGATGALRQIQDLGVFMFISGLTEPDDDETCFVTASGAWILQSPSMDVIDAFLRPELEEMREDITTLQGGGSAATSSAGSSGAVYGQAFYGFGNGTYTWTCPPGVTSVSAVCIGGGASSLGGSWSAQAGGGGGLGWKNNIAVVPGTTYTVEVGKGGDGGQTNYAGGDSWFISTSTVRGIGATSGTGGGFVGDGGGNGGSGGQYGGGGAGGYSGNGGNQDASGSGGGAAGGGSYSSTHGGYSGGGTGPFGQGASGAARSYYGGQGGSGGQDGMVGENPYFSYGVTANRMGGLFGGGGAGTGTSNPGGPGINMGGRGCVRIIWGPGRSFPSTGTSDY